MSKPQKKTKRGLKPSPIDSAFTGLFNFAQGSYLDSTRRPFYGLFFLLPLIIVYEICVLQGNTNEFPLKVATFEWLISLATWIGVHPTLAWSFPGFVVLVILMFWQLSSDYTWKIKPKWLGWMWIESIILSAPLFIILFAQNAIQNALFYSPNGTTTMATLGNLPYLAGISPTIIPKIVISIGAGIYEELVFRLILLGLLLTLLEDVIKIHSAMAVTIATLVSAVLFSLHHYIGIDFSADNFSDFFCKLEGFTLYSFFFRTLAGIYFAVLFHYRGYGITAGAHCMYDIIVSFCLFFSPVES
ncbi:MAG: CPBP family intramembrane metalloprotease [Phycisphaerae bacterium]|nr:CPBP family intramembrane metalloprotease [Phycisphaerae bacterium]